MILLNPRNFLVFFFLGAMFTAAGQSSAPQWATVKAFLPRWEGADVIVKINNTSVHSGKVTSGMFSFNYQPSGVSEAMLEVRGARSAHLFFFSEPGVIRITDDGRKLMASGTRHNDLYTGLEKEWDSLATIHTDSRIAGVKKLKRELVARLIADQPSSLVSLRMLYQFYFGEKDASDTVYFRLYHLLSPEMKSTATGRKIEKEITSRYKVAIGRPAPQMLLPDVSKALHPVYRKGEFTLIQFWASWCNPCSKFNQTLQQFDSLPVPGLVLVGISLDANYAAWTNAIKKEKLGWQQLSDLKGWNGQVALSYNVESIPSNILVDPDGIIIARNVSADDLRKLIPAATPKTF